MELTQRAQILIDATDFIIDQLKIEDHPCLRDAINLADLGCREVHFVVNDYGDNSVEVLIEEASPGCIEFNSEVSKRLLEAGFVNTYSRTEW